MNVFDLAAKITLDTSGYVDGLTKMAKLGGTMLTGAGLAILAFGKSAVSTGQEFDKSMSQVAATQGKTMSEMEQSIGSVDLAWGTFSGNLREYAMEMGEHTAFSAKESADALNYMALAGYDTQKSMEMLPNVLNLAAAGNMDLARASDMVTDTETAFGMSTERTAQMVDEMAKAASTGNTSVEQLGDAFLVVGGLAQDLNGGMVTLADGTQKPVDGIQELEIALTAMANAGIKGSEAGTHMRNMLLKLSSPTDEGAKALESLGVSVFDAEGNMRSLQDIMGGLSDSLGNLTQEEKLQAISAIFNTRDIAAAEALLNAVEQDWNHIGAEILDAEGAAQKMADTQLDNLAGDITLFKSALEGAKITVSDVLTPSLRDFVQFGTESVSQLSSAFREEGLGGAMEALGGIITAGVEKIVSGTPGFIQAAARLVRALIKGLKDSLPTLINAAMDIGKSLLKEFLAFVPEMLALGATILAGLATGLADAIPELVPVMLEGVGTIVDTVLDNIGMLVDAGITLLVALGDGLITALPQLVQAIPRVINAIINGIRENLPRIIEAGVTLFTSLIDNLPEAILTIVAALPEIITGIIDALLENIPLLVDAGVQLFVALVQNLPEIIAGIVEAIPQIIAAILDSLGGLGDAIAGVFSAAWDAVVAVWDTVVDFFQAIWDGIVAIFEGIVDWFSDLFSGAAEGVEQAWDGIVSFFSGIWNGIVSVFRTVGGWFYNIFKGAATFISDAWSSVVSFFQGIWDGIVNIFESVGEWFGGIFEGAVELIEQAWDGVVSFFEDIWEGITQPIQDFNDWVGEIMEDSGVQVGTSFETGLGDKVAYVTTGKIAQPLKDVASNAKTWGADLVENLIAGLNSKEGRMRAAVNGLAGIINGAMGHSVPKEGPLKNELQWMPHMMQNFARGIRDNAYLVTDELERAMQFEPIVEAGISADGFGGGASPYNQTINIYSPKQLTPYEIARQTRNATRDTILQMRGAR